MNAFAPWRRFAKFGRQACSVATSNLDTSLPDARDALLRCEAIQSEISCGVTCVGIEATPEDTLLEVRDPPAVVSLGDGEFGT